MTKAQKAHKKSRLARLRRYAKLRHEIASLRLDLHEARLTIARLRDEIDRDPFQPAKTVAEIIKGVTRGVTH